MKRKTLALAGLVLLSGTVGLPAGGRPGPAARQGAAREDVARFAARADDALSRGSAGKAGWGALISDAATGEILYARNADGFFAPASNAKLFTTTLALATLGPGFRIRTTIESAARPDREGKLAGDLFLVGRGDGNLSNRVFPFTKRGDRSGPADKVLAQLADQVAAHGVREVTGDVVADDSYFGAQRFPSGWTVDDTVWSYGAAVSPIAVNDNAMTLEVRPGAAAGAPLRVELAPQSGVYRFRVDGTTTAAGSMPQLRLARDPDSRVFVISGTLPLDAAPRPLQVAVPEPAENAAGLLVQLLRARGVRVRGHAAALHAGDPTGRRRGEGTVLAEHLSPTLLEDVRLTNKISLNLHAELMLRVAAKEKGGALIMDDALMFATQFWQSIGIAPNDAQLTDGSGLSRNDLVTPRAVVQLLSYAARQPWGAEFASTLPVAGEDGTLENRMKGSAADGRVHAKTGYINHAAALSGYATTVRGERLLFSFFGNAISSGAGDATGALDALCIAMVEELGSGPNANASATQ